MGTLKFVGFNLDIKAVKKDLEKISDDFVREERLESHIPDFSYLDILSFGVDKRNIDYFPFIDILSFRGNFKNRITLRIVKDYYNYFSRQGKLNGYYIDLVTEENPSPEDNQRIIDYLREKFFAEPYMEMSKLNYRFDSKKDIFQLKEDLDILTDQQKLRLALGHCLYFWGIINANFSLSGWFKFKFKCGNYRKDPIGVADTIAKKYPELVSPIWNSMMAKITNGRNLFDKDAIGYFRQMELDDYLKQARTVGWKPPLERTILTQNLDLN